VNKKRFAVVGVGSMGANHVRVLADIPEVDLLAVCDADEQVVGRTARRYNIPNGYTEVAEMLSRTTLDAVVIAVPTQFHASIALQCLERGINVLIEKPMATTAEECRRIEEAGRRAGVRIMIGHIERFNPAVTYIASLLQQDYLGKLYYVETVRSGPFPKRLYGSKDGVTADLAVHDLDLVAHLFGDLVHIYAHDICINEGAQDIYARAMFKTTSGVVGTSEFSWISPRKERSISIYGDKGMLFGNLLDQEVWFYENGDVSVDTSDNYFQNVLWGRVSEGKVVKFPIKKLEPLKAELSHFVAGIAGGGLAECSYGIRAVEYSQALRRAAAEDRIVHLREEGSR
jgi:UDP-N-acetylglucosamine 3-dehydrogenase